MIPDDLTCLVRAAGTGSRLGRGPKAWVLLAGAPLLAWALRPLADQVGEVIVAVPPADLPGAHTRLPASGMSGARVRFIAGSTSRWETTHLLAEAASTPWVMLHDAVHPLVSTRLVVDLITAAEQTGAAVPTLPTVDFTWDAEAASIRAPGRMSVIQTPIVLRLDRLRAGLALVGAEESQVGPEGSILEVLMALEQPWATVPGDARNLKVTWPADLDLAEALLAVERRSPDAPTAARGLGRGGGED